MDSLSSEGPGRLSRIPRRPTAADEVALYIKREIFEGRLEPGQRVPQAEIAAELGMSATPVREALAALARDGSIIVRQRRGAFVAPFDTRTIRNHFALCGAVFGFAAGRAAVEADPETVPVLERMLGRLVAADDAGAFFAIVMECYATINRQADSPTLRAVLRALVGIVPGNMFDTVPATRTVALEGLPHVVRAIACRDAKAAERACASMFQGHGEAVLAHLRERGLLEADGTPDVDVPATLAR